VNLRKTVTLARTFVSSAMLMLTLGEVQAQTQTPGQITQFDPSLNIVDSVITQDPSGNIGIGTTAPAARLDVTAGNVNLEISSASSGNILKGGVLFLHNAGPANTFIGENAGNLSVSGDDNTAAGFNALRNIAGGFSNTAVGGRALLSDTSGDTNSAFGRDALLFNDIGSQNTAVGRSALISNTSGSFNTATGVNALQTNHDGIRNTAVGESALFANTSGNTNTAVGDEALKNATGSDNIALGWQAGINVGGGSDNIQIGNNGSSGDANTIRIGNCLGGIFGCAHSRFFAAGIVNSSVSGVQVLITGDGQLGVAPSSMRFKEQIQDMGDASSRLRRLRPVTFYYKQAAAGGSRQLQYGLIAEEVAQVYPELVQYSDTGEPFSVRYQLLGPMLLNEVQKQARQIEEQRLQIHAQEMQIAELKAQAAKLVELQVRIAAIAGRLEKLDPTTVVRASAGRTTP